MSVALLLVTHEYIGNDLLKVTGSIVNDNLDNTACVEVPMDADAEAMKRQINDSLDKLSTDEGVLILTDSYGSTPCNIAAGFLDREKRALVSGINLPMLVRIMNYRSLSLDRLKDIAVEGGVRGITTRT